MLTLPAPRGLKTEGKKAWELLAMVDHLTDDDYFFAVDFAKNADELRILELEFKRSGDYTVWTNNDQTIMLHPLRKEIAELNKVRREILRELGLSVKQRVQLEIAVKEVIVDPVADALEGLEESRNAHDND